jgi:hypothetical protein
VAVGISNKGIVFIFRSVFIFSAQEIQAVIPELRFYNPLGATRDATQYHIPEELNRQRYSFKRFLGAFAKLRESTISFMSVCSAAWNNSNSTGRIFMKFDI